ncbi:MAG: RDD family protein [Saprospiraceae bacterium]
MPSIDITTTQNVTIEYELSPLRFRMLAYVLDLMLVLGVYFMFLQLVMMIAGDGFGDNMGWLMVLGLFPFLLFMAYYIFFEIWNIGQTPGKMALGIKVVRLDGKDPDWSDVVLRATMHLVDTLFTFGVIGSVLIKTTGKMQRLGDIAANTTVIKISSANLQFRLQDILNISSVDTYKPVYPQVKHFTEQDMIFIKTALTRVQQFPNNAHQDVIEDLVTHLMPLLGLQTRPSNRIEFLKTLLRDYIVLTR